MCYLRTSERLYSNMVKAGEFVDDVLNQLMTFCEKSLKLCGRVKFDDVLLSRRYGCYRVHSCCVDCFCCPKNQTSFSGLLKRELSSLGLALLVSQAEQQHYGIVLLLLVAPLLY